MVSREIKIVTILSEAGPEAMAQSSRCEVGDFAWRRPHAPQGRGKTFTGSKLGDRATAPDFHFDGRFDIDASKKANASE